MDEIPSNKEIVPTDFAIVDTKYGEVPMKEQKAKSLKSLSDKLLKVLPFIQTVLLQRNKTLGIVEVFPVSFIQCVKQFKRSVVTTPNLKKLRIRRTKKPHKIPMTCDMKNPPDYSAA